MSARDWLLFFVSVVVAGGIGSVIYFGGLGRWVRGFRAPSWLRGLAWIEGLLVFLLLACVVKRDAVQDLMPALVAYGILIVAGIVVYVAFMAASANTIEH